MTNIAFWADGVSLTCTPSKEATLHKPKPPVRSEFQDEEEYEKAVEESEWELVSRRWFYTQFSIKAGEQLTLEVHYCVRNSRTTPSSMYTSSFRMAGYSWFTYDLSPAAHWGNGRVNHLSVEIDTHDIEPTHPYLEEGEKMGGVWGMPFRKDGSILRYETNNFSFKDSAPIQFGYDLRNKGDLVSVLKYRISPQNYTITASDNQPKYPVKNLSDLDLSTAWVATVPNGTSSQLTITFKKPVPLTNILIAGGYLKNEETFVQNMRPKLISGHITGKQAEKQEDGTFIKWTDYETDFSISFEENLGVSLSLDNLLGFSGIYSLSAFESEVRVSKLELNVESYYYGTKYMDFCISEILLLNRPIIMY